MLCLLYADVESDDIDIESLSKEQLDMIEADSYWCMSKLLDGIQDNYTFAQPGIQKKVAALKELTLRIDGKSASLLRIVCWCLYAEVKYSFTNVPSKFWMLFLSGNNIQTA